MPTWPSTLPAPRANSFKETPPKLVLRTEMDAGPPKVRRRFTSGVRKVVFQLLLTKAQVTILDDFFTSTVSSGALEFDFTHPRTNTDYVTIFTKEPSYSSVDPDTYTASVELDLIRTTS